MRILAIDIGGTAIKYGVVSDTLEVLNAYETPTEAQEGGAALLEKILGIIETQRQGIDCVGISTAGQVDCENGCITFANENIPGYSGMQIRKAVRGRFHLPVYVENDVNAAATAEAVLGAGKGIDSFLCLTYGTGVGGAIWQNGGIYRGETFSAGDFGHIITHVGGRKCGCGENGCYEAYASATALVRFVEEKTKMVLTGREIFSPEHFQNSSVREAVDTWITEVAAGLLSLISAFNPKCVILGGGIMNEPYIIESLQTIVASKKIPHFKAVKIVPAALRNHAGMLGAAYLAKEYALGRRE